MWLRKRYENLSSRNNGHIALQTDRKKKLEPVTGVTKWCVYAYERMDVRFSLQLFSLGFWAYSQYFSVVEGSQVLRIYLIVLL